MVHVAVVEGNEGLIHFPLAHTAATCFCYVIGAGIYVMRLPEKYWPHTFDLLVSRDLKHRFPKTMNCVAHYDLEQITGSKSSNFSRAGRAGSNFIFAWVEKQDFD